MSNNIKTKIINGKCYLQICNIDFTLDDDQIEKIINSNNTYSAVICDYI